MSQLGRLDVRGVVHHILIRRIQHRKIFVGHKNPEDFLGRLSNLLAETKTACDAKEAILVMWKLALSGFAGMS
jgi:hypothetical protein